MEVSVGHDDQVLTANQASSLVAAEPVFPDSLPGGTFPVDPMCSSIHDFQACVRAVLSGSSTTPTCGNHSNEIL